MEDIRQETFLRVFQAIRRNTIRDPARIGAFVNSVCNNVILEFGRSGSRVTYRRTALPTWPTSAPTPNASW